jgi:hypothetical protein
MPRLGCHIDSGIGKVAQHTYHANMFAAGKEGRKTMEACRAEEKEEGVVFEATHERGRVFMH